MEKSVRSLAVRVVKCVIDRTRGQCHTRYMPSRLRGSGMFWTVLPGCLVNNTYIMHSNLQTLTTCPYCKLMGTFYSCTVQVVPGPTVSCCVVCLKYTQLWTLGHGPTIQALVHSARPSVMHLRPCPIVYLLY